MVELNTNEVLDVNGGKISIGKLFGGIIAGAIGGLLRGIPGGPVVMLGSAVAGAGLGAFGVALNDAIEIRDEYPEGS